MYSALVDEFQINGSVVPLGIVIFRMFAATLMGGIIGWEREHNARAAGLRTHMMISVASCLFAIVALDLIALDTEDQERIKADPIKLISAITSGVAFLAAGSIIISGGKVHGLTTGASMWLVGAVGLSCGTGRIPLALVATVIALIILWIVNRVAERPKKKIEDARDDDEDEAEPA
ncbi:MgtC/SapB family protein [Neptunicoccus cionae]|uniref:MgtC/SapB family protein n=1 Tax=Neptunicoccus cionae TaxID=2035344 RepID=UPI000C76D0FB|nr:MgtC/SapB family protein [Amylibacter cionae]PLS21973.1 hypothetical protein C0U40_05905 [Amylibacter cionae]